MRRRARSSHKGEVRDIPDIGDIFCSDKKFRTLHRYLSEGRSDAEGVVFNIKLGTAYLISLVNYRAGLSNTTFSDPDGNSTIGADLEQRNFNDLDVNNLNHPQNGKAMTLHLAESPEVPPLMTAAYQINKYATKNIPQGNWYLPAIQELYEIWKNRELLITVLNHITTIDWMDFFNGYIASVTPRSRTLSRMLHFGHFNTGEIRVYSFWDSLRRSVAITQIDFASSVHVGDIYLGGGEFTCVDKYVAGDLGIVYYIDNQYVYAIDFKNIQSVGSANCVDTNFNTFGRGANNDTKLNKLSGMEDTLSIIEQETLDSELGVVKIFKDEKYNLPVCAASVGDLSGIVYNYWEMKPAMEALGILPDLKNGYYSARNEYDDTNFSAVVMNFLNSKSTTYPYGVQARISAVRKSLPNPFVPIIPIPHSLVRL